LKKSNEATQIHTREEKRKRGTREKKNENRHKQKCGGSYGGQPERGNSENRRERMSIGFVHTGILEIRFTLLWVYHNVQAEEKQYFGKV